MNKYDLHLKEKSRRRVDLVVPEDSEADSIEDDSNNAQTTHEQAIHDEKIQSAPSIVHVTSVWPQVGGRSVS